MFSFSKSDKVLVVAPHPDDESLGAGGLLQQIFARKIPVRILFATNGENNPWAQRFWESRWQIGPNERMRWGQRRRQEALNAISTLGGKPDCARFLNLPDLGTTNLLMQGDPEQSVLIADNVREWEPTVALIPTVHDAHPDHNALSVAFSMALDSVGGSSIQVWEYLVHKAQGSIPQKPVTLPLSTEEVERKRRAILCHQTQMALSRRRFTSFAMIEEAYYPHNAIGAKAYDAPLAAVRLHEGMLSLQFTVSKRDRFHSEILFVFGSGSAKGCRWSLSLPFRSGKAQIWDTIRGQRLHEASVQWRGPRLFVDIPVSGTSDFDVLYVKLSGWTLFFDRSGWTRFTVPVSCEESLVQRANVPGVLTLL